MELNQRNRPAKKSLMRPLTILLILCCFWSCAVREPASPGPVSLNGTWIPVKQELAGMPMPASAFESYRLILTDSLYSYGSTQADQGTIRYANGKMDIYGRVGPNSGKHFTAIYKHTNGQLTICYNLAGDSYPVKFDSRDHPMFFLAVFKKNE